MDLLNALNHAIIFSNALFSNVSLRAGGIASRQLVVDKAVRSQQLYLIPKTSDQFPMVERWFWATRGMTYYTHYHTISIGIAWQFGVAI